MKRRLLNLLTALSLLLCAAVVVLWVRSYSGADQFAVWRGGTVRVVRSYDGSCEYFVSRYASTPAGWTRTGENRPRDRIWSEEWSDTHFHLPHLALLAAAAVLPVWRFLIGVPPAGIRPKHVVICVSVQVVGVMAGFAAALDRDQVHAGVFVGAVALSVALFCVRDLIRESSANARVPPPWRLLARRAWNRHRRGVCPFCAYDLTGNVSGVCPECGETSAAATSTSWTPEGGMVSEPPWVLHYTQIRKPLPLPVRVMLRVLKLGLVAGATVAVVLIMTITFVFLFRVFALLF